MSDSNNNKKDFNLSQFRRNNYFYGKLMTVIDFNAEQIYMNEKRHLLNRLVNGPGVIYGLSPNDVSFDVVEGKVKIIFETRGVAIDCWGREIVVPVPGETREIFVKEGSTESNLTTFHVDGAQYYLYLEYDEQPGEMVSSGLENSSCEENRIIEDFKVIASTQAPDTPGSPGSPDPQTIGSPDSTGETSEDDAKQEVKDWLKDRTSDLCTAPAEGKVFFLALKKGSSPVSSDDDSNQGSSTVSIDEVETNKYLSFVTNNSAFSELLACHLSDFGNPHKTTAAQVGAIASVDGVRNDGGNVDLVEENSITITPDDEANTIKIGETHSAKKDNPHETNHSQILNVLKVFDDDEDDAGNKHISNNDGENWNSAYDHSNVKDSNPHETNHSQILNVLKVFDDDEDDAGNKHISNNDGEKWNSAYDHSNVKDSNPHQTKHSQILNVLKVFDDDEDDAGNKHISNNDGENWNSAYDHSNVKDSNPHETKHNQILDVLPINPEEKNAERVKHVSNNDAISWNLAFDHSNVKDSNPHETKHNQILDVLPINPEEKNAERVKHVSNNDAISWNLAFDHSGVKGSNPHETNHSQILNALEVFEDEDDDARNKHISNNDAEKWNKFVEESGVRSIAGVVHHDGDVALVAENSIVIKPDDINNKITFGENHSAKTDNPHEVKMSQLKDFNADNNRIINLEAPTDNNDAANKKYVDGKYEDNRDYIDTHDHSSAGGAQIKHSSLDLTGEEDNPHNVKMSELRDFDAKENQITNLSDPDPKRPQDAATKGYVDTHVTAVTSGKLVTNGDDHDHSGGDGAIINHSNLNLNDGNNPHQVGMSHLADLKVADNGDNIDANTHKIVNLSYPQEAQDAANKGYVDNKTAAVQEGALSTSGGFVTGPIHIKTKEWSALTGNATETYGVMGRLTKDLETGSDYRTAGLVGVSEIDGKHGVYAKAPEGTHALYVQGSALFTGPKTGYVVDIFKNASGKTLKTGDVVKLKGTPVNRFFGDNKKIPVAEVTLADKENDNCTIGIVDRKAIPEEIKTGKKSKAGDPSVIKDGEELYVVTLGTYFRCKADAADAPIKVGDLLTSSKNPGFARKAADPKIGSIIGKALEPLGKGTGHIAVFVNIQ